MSVIAHMRADRHRLFTKATQSLLGICTGLIADGELNDIEIRFLSLWMKENEEVFSSWPGDVLGQRVAAILADGIITDSERKDLLNTLTAVTSADFTETGAADPTTPNSLPIDDSADVLFTDKEFCFTGKFLYGTRLACTRTTTTLGGIVADKVTQHLDYLVIGALINPTWAYEAHGRKIELAATMNKNQPGQPHIISEKHWVAAVKKALG